MEWGGGSFGKPLSASAPPPLAPPRQNCLFTILGAGACGKGGGPGVGKSRPETPFLPLSYPEQGVSSFGLNFDTL